MKGSSVEFFNSLFKKGLQSQDDSAAAGPSSAAAKKPGPAARGKKVAFVSVGSQFRAQLQDLMSTLSDTNPYFIRCIKPNPQKVRGIFNRASVSQNVFFAYSSESSILALFHKLIRRFCWTS
jgi:myosin heavy subunit